MPAGRRLRGPGATSPGFRVTTRVTIVDDQAMVRTGLASIVSGEPDLEVVGLAANGAEAIAEARRTESDVVLMDIRMPVMDGLEATRQLTAAGSRVGWWC